MARLDIAKPYEEFLRHQVEIGMFRSITSAAEDAIRKQMVDTENRRIQSVFFEIAIGEAEIKNGKTVPYTSDLIENISSKIKSKQKS
jgi:hypothetical protein